MSGYAQGIYGVYSEQYTSLVDQVGTGQIGVLSWGGATIGDGDGLLRIAVFVVPQIQSVDDARIWRA